MSNKHHNDNSPKPISVVIYARYSCHLQNDRSIEDQIALCKANLKPGEVVTAIFVDRAASGAYMVNRPGIQALLAYIKAEKCDVILAESLDRFSRAPDNLYYIFKMANFHHAETRTVQEKVVTSMMISWKGGMAALYREQMQGSIKRGQEGNIRVGKAAGNTPYGYSIKSFNDAGEPERGLREIRPDQAEVVRRIYTDYAAGVPVARIVRALNEEGIPGPTGGKWWYGTVNGNFRKRSGILANPLYRGLLVWGRSSGDRHPVTAKKRVTFVDESEWITKHVPALQIVDDDLFERVYEMRRRQHEKWTTSNRTNSDPFDLECICQRCGDKVVRVEKPYIICGQHKVHQTCSNGRRYAIKELVGVLSGLLSALPRAEWQAWLDVHEGRWGDNDVRSGKLDEQVEQETARLERLLNALADGLSTSKALKQRIEQTEANIEVLQAERESIGHLPHPDRLSLETLQAKVAGTPESDRRQLVESLLHSVVLDRDEAGNIVIGTITPDWQAIAALTD